MARLSLIALSSIVFLTSASADALKDTLPHISVTGEASEDEIPDSAKLLLDIVTERPTAVEAVDENAQKTRALLEDLARQGIRTDGIRASGSTLVSLRSDGSAARGAHAGRVSRSFRVRNELSVLVNSLDTATAIFLRAVDSGSNDVRGMEFIVGDETARSERLRVAAIKNAEQRARSYVEALGSKLGRIIEIAHDEVTRSDDVERESTPTAAAPTNGAIALPLRPGARRLTAKVSVTWALSR
ncbi:SIMPL domain-containing protein [Methylosinus sp. LW4]|uniref:SIMPL domain-containing protein n=1 Tax=Methylosinus sp. LW4 TaxID=136993 RepID=UPI0003778EDC|nr:SIMPL domain-containing protein [Methylosinus sp. LW4]